LIFMLTHSIGTEQIEWSYKIKSVSVSASPNDSPGKANPTKVLKNPTGTGTASHCDTET